MRLYLLTIESVSSLGDLLEISPKVPLDNLHKNMLMPMRGDGLELHLPDGITRHATIGSFGISHREIDGNLYTTDLSPILLTLSVAGGLQPEDVPPGTEIWLSDAKHALSPSGS